MKKAKVVIKNETGLHARPASQFVKKAGEYKSEIKITRDKDEVNAISIMGVMSLGAEKGSEIIIEAEGEDEDTAIAELVNYLENVLPAEDE
ncbi:MAG: HPr family phosphocarrier protein [Halanaerobiales bacterium]